MKKGNSRKQSSRVNQRILGNSKVPGKEVKNWNVKCVENKGWKKLQ